MEKQLEIIQHNNPFDISDITRINVPSGTLISTVLKSIEYDTKVYDLVVSKNNEIIDCEFVLEEDDFIAFLLVPKGGGGGGKQTLMLVAMIAVAVMAPMAAGAMMGATAGMVGAGVYGGLSGSIIFGTLVGGIMLGSAMVLQSIFKPQIPNGDFGAIGGAQSSPTYGWNVAGNNIQQGGSIPILYGKHRVIPQFIGKNLVTLNDAQYLSILMAICEGEIDSAYDILINDAPISDFKEVMTAVRNGTNDQEVLPLWTDTWTDQNVGKKLTNTTDWVYATTLGDSVTELSVNILCPQGLYYASDTGGLDNYEVQLDIEYKKIGDTLWSQVANDFINTTYYYVDQTPITKTMTDNYGRSYSVLIPDEIGTFDIYRSQYIATNAKGGSVIREHIGTTITLPTGLTQSIWQQPTSYFDPTPTVYAWSKSIAEPISIIKISGAQNSPLRRSFVMHNIPAGQYEVRARFYTQPTSGTRYASTVVFDFLQEAISDDFTYPNTALLSVKAMATDQLSGGFPRISCMVERTTGTYGRLDNPAWACLDLLMNDRYGAGIPLSRIDFASFQTWADYCTQENFTVNIYLDQGSSLSQCLRLVGQNGRGSVIQYGSTFTALVDMPNITAVQGFLFSMGNIIQNSFSESFLPLKDRANIIEVSYYDENEGYQRTSVEVSHGNYDLTTNVNKTAIDLIGCTNRTQALRQAKYHINQNRYLTITASWEASIDSIHCRVGDVVNLAHDVPQWGYSGRIVSATGTTIEVDRDDLVMEFGKTYYIQISNGDTDTQLYHKVTSVNGFILTLETALSEIASMYSVYSFGEVNRHAKQMRIMSITTSGELKRKISAIEYNSDIYSDTVDIQAPILVSDLTIGNIYATDYLRISTAGIIETVVALSWRGSYMSYAVSYVENIEGAIPISIPNVRTSSVEISGLKDGSSYTFTINNQSIIYVVQGKISAPDAVTNLVGIEMDGVYKLTWDYPFFPVDFSYFLILENGNEILRVTTKNADYINSTSKQKNFTVYAVDTSGNKSTPNYLSVSITPLPNITGFVSYYSNDILFIKWDKANDPRLIDYEIRSGTVWEDGGRLGRTQNTEYKISSGGDFMVKAHYYYQDGTHLYSETTSTISISVGILPKNIIASYDEKSTNWLGAKTNVFINGSNELEMIFNSLDDTLIFDNLPVVDEDAGVYSIGYYEIPSSHIVDVGTVQLCRIWVDYKVYGKVIANTFDYIKDIDSYLSIDGNAKSFDLKPQISIAQLDGVFGAWQDFAVGEYVGRKFKFRGIFYSYDQNTTCVLSEAKFYVDMTDKIQTGTGVALLATGSNISYPNAFQIAPNLQTTIINAQAGDDIIITNETSTGFTAKVLNAGVGVIRNINWMAKGY